MGSDVKKMHEARDPWDKVCAEDRVELLPEPEAIEGELRGLSALRSPSPKIWIDAYLLAFASVAGLKLVTFDFGFRSRGAAVHVR